VAVERHRDGAAPGLVAAAVVTGHVDSLRFRYAA
jgi:hypothetical protein